MPATSFTAFLDSHPNSILVEISEAKGSTPRDEGTVMLVAQDSIWGTIGGGQFEFMAINNARAMLKGAGQEEMDIPLGPEIGQCCGGRTRLLFTPVTQALAAQIEQRLKREDRSHPAVFLFGAGHVGLALAKALSPLPLAVTVVETRADVLDTVPREVTSRHVALPEAMVAEISAGGAAVILTHDHALDFLIAREALARRDLAYVGMIGSQTKRATFVNWMKREGADTDLIDSLILPIGGDKVRDKRPEVIAAMVAAELLTVLFSPTAHRLRGG